MKKDKIGTKKHYLGSKLCARHYELKYNNGQMMALYYGPEVLLACHKCSEDASNFRSIPQLLEMMSPN